MQRGLSAIAELFVFEIHKVLVKTYLLKWRSYCFRSNYDNHYDDHEEYHISIIGYRLFKANGNFLAQ